MRIIIEFDLDEEWQDPEHVSGMTEEASEKIAEFTNEMGTNLDVRRRID